MIIYDASWPTILPLPLYDYTGVPRNSSLVSPSASIISSRRGRNKKAYDTLNVKWVFTPAQYYDFLDFFENDLCNGAAIFSMELRYPKNSDLDVWGVRFSAGYSASFLEGPWGVDAQLELVNKITETGTGSSGMDSSGGLESSGA